MLVLAESEIFELSQAFRSLPVFKTGPFSHLGKLLTGTQSKILIYTSKQ